MQIDKQEILDLLDALGRQDDRERAERELPDRVDTDRDAELLDRYGLDADRLAGKAEAQGVHGGQEGGLLAGEGV